MTDRERILAVLNYRQADRLPIVHFGYWGETLQKWRAEGHLTKDEAANWADGNPTDAQIARKLGFDCQYYSCFHTDAFLRPAFESRVVKTFPDGSSHVLNGAGVIYLSVPGTSGIPPEIDHLLKGRKEWEEHFKHRFRFHPDRVLTMPVRVNDRMVPFNQGGLEFLKADRRDYPCGLHCGSLFGSIRNMIGVENCAYLALDDEPLFDEIVQTVGDLCYQCVKTALDSGAKFDFAHFWEDICYKNGPLISPSVFAAKVGPQYKRITDLVHRHGLNIVSLDCDGWIDALIPVWLESGVNTMFPIEVGTWNASIAPWRAKYGQELRGVGGMNKVVFARGRAAVDAEIERMKPLVALGGFIPCPDHRIAPDAEWDTVRYYCDRMRATFG
ncbi:MAG: uroporphyrinogen decarboxylase family protein [Kiritimatiellae bacterium]|nr:uroporphyrinogen decarboxylase family protein [Kiritimatiellia bacterium]